MFVSSRSPCKTLVSSFYRGLHNSKPGVVLSRGNGVFGALGNGSLSDNASFSPIVIDNPDKFVNVSAGWGHSAAVSESGKLYIWGRPYDFSNLMRINRIYGVSKKLAQFIAHSSNSGIFGKTNAFLDLPTALEGFNNVSTVSCSAGLSIFNTSEGDVYAFGLNRWSQCGVSVKDTMHIYQPAKLPVPSSQKVVAGLQHGLSLSMDGRLFVWGKGSKGQLGLGETENVSTLPREILLFVYDRHGVKTMLKAVDVCAGFAHSGAVTEDGGLYVWGKGMSESMKDRGKGYIEVSEDQWTPRRITLPGKRNAVKVYSRYAHLLAASSSLQILILFYFNYLVIFVSLSKQMMAHCGLWVWVNMIAMLWLVRCKFRLISSHLLNLPVPNLTNHCLLRYLMVRL